MSVTKTEKKTKDGRCWFFRTRIDGKQYNSKMFATKREALEAEREFVEQNKYKELKASRITFNDAIKEYLENEKQNTKPSTYRQEVKLCEHISNALGDVVIEKLTVQQYKNFRQGLLDKGFSVCYSNKIINHCKSIIRIVNVRYGVFTRVPEGFKPLVDNEIKEEMKFYTLDEFKQFISAVDDNVYKAFFLLLFFCGLRCGEANGLQWQDVDFEKGIISIRRTVNTKMRADDGSYLITTPKTKSSIRNIPVPKLVLDALKIVYNEWSQCEEFNTRWFVFGGFKAIAESTLHKAYNKYADMSNSKHIRLHDFRHSCVAYYISYCNADILMVSHLLGHASVEKTLNIYGHFYPNKLKALMAFSDGISI